MSLETILILLIIGSFVAVCLYALIIHVVETLINKKRGF